MLIGRTYKFTNGMTIPYLTYLTCDQMYVRFR